jgi:hypothetical protein
MSTTLRNNYINKFDEKLKVYNNIFFKVLNSYDLLSELNNVTNQPNTLNIPSDSSSTYSTEQFNNFIRNIINFKIKNNDDLQKTDNNMDFINRTVADNGTESYDYNTNIKTNIIETQKVINVFVDILEAYKYCIENEDNTISPSGYTKDIEIERIEIVSDTTRFYTSQNTGMYPSAAVKNAGYIRYIKEDNSAGAPTIKVLYLSIQSFYTGFETSNSASENAKYTYNMFTKDCITGTRSDKIDNNIIAHDVVNVKINTTSPAILVSPANYARQKYNEQTADIIGKNVSLEQRNKALINLLLKTLFNIPQNFRKQSVFALYYYYRFIQLYSTLIINVSNVMYASVKNSTPKCIDVYNTGRERYITGIQVSTAGASYATDTQYIIKYTNNADDVVTANILSNNSGAIIKDTVATITTRAPFTVLPSTLTLGITPAKPTPGLGVAAGANVAFKITDVPLAIENTLLNDIGNIERLKTVIDDISNSITTLISDLSKYSINLDSNSLTITTDSEFNPAEITISSEKKVVIIISNPGIYVKLKKYNDSYDIINNYIIYDRKNVKYYEILDINVIDDPPKSIQITINAVINKSDITNKGENIEVFLDANGTEIASGDKIPSSDSFLEIKKKDINAYKNEYIYNKNTVEILNEGIAYNTNKVQHQKNMYDSQLNKNTFLTRQILTYNIIISIIVLILIFINITNIDKHIIKTISLACLAVILLLFVIYIISNITYIETFAVTDTGNALNPLTINYYNNFKLNQHTYNILKAKTLNTQIDELNKKFINYFEKILITIPASDNIDFYREIKEGINTEIDNKSYIQKLLEFNRSQGDNNMGSLRYEIENNKLYILTLLISSVIFIGLYNIYINYIVSDKYLSLMIFICIILFIIIVSYYIINSNKRVRTVYKNKYWGPETSKYF